MDAEHQDLVAQFSEITGANPSVGQATLESVNWNLERAVAIYFSDKDYGMDDEPEDFEDEAPLQPAAANQPSLAQPSSSGAITRGSGNRPKQMTLEDLKKMQDQDEDESDEEKKRQNMFAGGEKSGLAVENPGQGGGPVDHFQNIMNQARQNRDRPAGSGETEQPQQSNNFFGRAQTLGGDDSESRVVEDPFAAARARQQASQRVTRTLHLWADGVSIDEGPLFRFDDPANQSMMAEINRGRAPMDLLDVQPNQEVDLNLIPHKDENYVPPKQKYKPFAGQGQRLGSPTPAIAQSSSSTTAAAPPQTAAGQQAAVTVDEAAPTIQLQIRLGDGTRLASRFNTTHTIGDVYTFVNHASTTSSQRPYALMTTFPSKELDDKSVVLGDMNDFKRGGVIVQKWK